MPLRVAGEDPRPDANSRQFVRGSGVRRTPRTDEIARQLMSVWQSLRSVRVIGRRAVPACVAAVAALPAGAGHEVPYYPSFYPQEIRIEPLDPTSAAREFGDKTSPLHVYIGASPRFTGGPPPHLKNIESLGSLITASVNLRSPRLETREARCAALKRAVSALRKDPDVVVHPYPVTPYHADYIGHVDRAPDPRRAVAEAEGPALAFRAAGGAANAEGPPAHAVEWDIAFDEIPLAEVMRKGGLGFNAWLAPSPAKEGWYQAYHLLRPAIHESAAQQAADALYGRLVHAEYRDLTERITLERGLVAALTAPCVRAVVGYRLRREFYSDDFSNGIENIAFDSQAGFNSPVFVRTVKLKDFPWNGWLRVGIDAPPTAAWNPVAGFTDAAGRLVWSTIGDDAFLPIPYNSGWAQNRAEIRPDDQAPNQSVRIPADALAPQPGTGRIAAVGPGRGAMAKVTYRLLASGFHDGAEMELADLVYPYALAFRWGEGKPGEASFDPELAAATERMRERLRGVRMVRVEETTLPLADLTFTYRSPILEVYLDNPGFNEEESALFAPPWSSVPWHVLALLEAAVERGIGAFSRGEAERRSVPWLDLVRDPAQRERLRALIKEFAQSGYRPVALEALVTAEAAKARWEALDKFVEANGHLLVTNGPYRLTSSTPEATVFEVVRDFTYPIGLGTFNSYAHPARAVITGLERAGDRILVAADVELAVKQQRDRRLVREPLRRETLRDTAPIRPVARYLAITEDGSVAAAGSAAWEADGRFAVSLPDMLPSGAYTVFVGIFLDGNTMHPSIGRIDYRRN
jgi:hypothetical protein